jgi:hypothetical protein
METRITKERIREKFLLLAIEHGIAYSNGNYKTANKFHKKLQSLYNQAKKQNQSDVFSEFIANENRSIRLWAASFTLRIFPDLAVKILEDISNISDSFGSTAKILLQLWREDNSKIL